MQSKSGGLGHAAGTDSRGPRPLSSPPQASRPHTSPSGRAPPCFLPMSSEHFQRARLPVLHTLSPRWPSWTGAFRRVHGVFMASHGHEQVLCML